MNYIIKHTTKVKQFGTFEASCLNENLYHTNKKGRKITHHTHTRSHMIFSSSMTRFTVCSYFKFISVLLYKFNTSSLPARILFCEFKLTSEKKRKKSAKIQHSITFQPCTWLLMDNFCGNGLFPMFLFSIAVINVKPGHMLSGDQDNHHKDHCTVNINT